jgi:hypothetical protein
MRTQLDNGEAKAKLTEKFACAFTVYSQTLMNTDQIEFSPVEKK